MSEHDFHKKNSSERFADIMNNAGVRPTAVRLLIYRLMESATNPVSSVDIETALVTVDRSTISRTVSVFLNHHLIHSIDDGSGLLKYEICRSEGNHSIHDMHVHFRCTGCGNTICLPSTAVPQVELPEGFVGNNVNYVISGLCDKCSTSTQTGCDISHGSE